MIDLLEFKSSGAFFRMPLLAFIVIISAACTPSESKTKITNAKFKTSHKVENDSLILTDKLSDFIPYGNGYAAIERNRSTVLILDENLSPVKRIGKQGDGPEELYILGGAVAKDSLIAILDTGHSRVVFLDNRGDFLKETKSDDLSRGIFGFLLDEDYLYFSIPEVMESIVKIDISSGDSKYIKHTLKAAFNDHHQSRGNRAYLFKSNDHYLHFHPTLMSVELMDADFDIVQELNLGKLSLWEHSYKRAEELYRTTNNSTLQMYSDVYQDGNNFFLLAYSDYPDNQNVNKFRRTLNQVIQLFHNPENNTVALERVINLDPDQYYLQIIVKGSQLLAFNLKTFFIDEYDISE